MGMVPLSDGGVPSATYAENNLLKAKQKDKKRKRHKHFINAFFFLVVIHQKNDGSNLPITMTFVTPGRLLCYMCYITILKLRKLCKVSLH